MTSRKVFTNWGLTWGGLLDNRKGEWWLIAQISLIIGHLIPSWPKDLLNLHWLNIIIETLGLIIILYGIYLATNSLLSLGDSLSPLPSPKEGSKLITNNQYKYCRHPIYKSILIISTGVVFTTVSILHLTLLLSLCIVLKGKARREERLLKNRYPEYINYMKKTNAIISKISYLNWKD